MVGPGRLLGTDRPVPAVVRHVGRADVSDDPVPDEIDIRRPEPVVGGSDQTQARSIEGGDGGGRVSLGRQCALGPQQGDSAAIAARAVVANRPCAEGHRQIAAGGPAVMTRAGRQLHGSEQLTNCRRRRSASRRNTAQAHRGYRRSDGNGGKPMSMPHPTVVLPLEEEVSAFSPVQYHVPVAGFWFRNTTKRTWLGPGRPWSRTLWVRGSKK